MIRYPQATPAEIRKRINANKPGWFARAKEETKKLLEAGAFTPPKASKGTPKIKAPPSIWGDVKTIFMALQEYKCIFCERALAKQEGAIEHDVEHYRPKNPIVAWRAPKPMHAVPHQAGPAATTGYYWLAYDIGNYAAACKLCNSTRKRSFFPINAQRGQACETITALDQKEEPLVIFPLADDPASLIRFDGILAVPVCGAGLGRLRAEVTIALFNLNGREELLDDRFRAIRAVFQAFQLLATSDDQAIRNDALTTLAELTSQASPQSACAMAYLKLLKTDADRAWTIYQDARAYIQAS